MAVGFPRHRIDPRGQPGTTVTVTANPSGLAAGDYYGQIQVSSPNAASPVQMVTVRFTVQTRARLRRRSLRVAR
jgi:hypothetical protein